MFYPKCPKCGGATTTVESNDFDVSARGFGHILRSASQAHPYLKALHLAATAGRQIYKRVPGGGEKQCRVCKHRFC